MGRNPKRMRKNVREMVSKQLHKISFIVVSGVTVVACCGVASDTTNVRLIQAIFTIMHPRMIIQMDMFSHDVTNA